MIMSRFMGLINFENQDYNSTITMFNKQFTVRIESSRSDSDTKKVVSKVTKELLKPATTKKICSLAVMFIKDSYGKKVTEDQIMKKVVPIAILIEDYDEVAIICDYDPWTNDGLGIQIIPNISVNDRAAFC